MISWNRICCAVDNSDSSDAAFETAVELALRFSTQLTILHVDQLPGYTLPDGPAFASAETLARYRAAQAEALNAYVERARDRGVSILDSASRLGDPATEIVEFAQAGNYDLIVVGTHGYSGLRHALMGSVAERVVRKSHCPVLTVHQREQLEQHVAH